MLNYRYETHIIKDPRLPFIFHRSYTHTRYEIPPNWHENIEILYCVEGTGYIKCGLEVSEFSAGDVFIVNADTPHCVGTQKTHTYRCLIIDNSFCTENGIPISELSFRNKIHDSAVSDLFEAVTNAFDHRDSGAVCAIADIRYAVLGLLRKLCSDYAVAKTDAPSQACEYVKKALSYIRQNLSDSITLDDIACHVGISKFHLSREFKTFTGRSIISTVNRIRCTEAKRLIEGGMRVSDAANACGFENLSYFTRSFKKYFQVPPSAFSGRGNRTT